MLFKASFELISSYFVAVSKRISCWCFLSAWNLTPFEYFFVAFLFHSILLLEFNQQSLLTRNIMMLFFLTMERVLLSFKIKNDGE